MAEAIGARCAAYLARRRPAGNEEEPAIVELPIAGRRVVAEVLAAFHEPQRLGIGRIAGRRLADRNAARAKIVAAKFDSCRSSLGRPGGRLRQVQREAPAAVLRVRGLPAQRLVELPAAEVGQPCCLDAHGLLIARHDHDDPAGRGGRIDGKEELRGATLSFPSSPTKPAR